MTAITNKSQLLRMEFFNCSNKLFIAVIAVMVTLCTLYFTRSGELF